MNLLETLFGPGGKGKFDVQCYKCQEFGHMAANCNVEGGKGKKGKANGCSFILAMALGISQVIARCVNCGDSSARLEDIEAWPSGRQLDVSIDLLWHRCVCVCVCVEFCEARAQLCTSVAPSGRRLQVCIGICSGFC